MVAFQFSGGENPSEIFRRQGLEMAVNGNGEVVVFLGDIEGEDFFQVKETVYNFCPFFIIDRAHDTPLILSFVQSDIGIIEDSLASRGACQDFGPFIRRIHSVKDSIISTEEAEYEHRAAHECLTEVFVSSADYIYL
jgi:hypothetical protein